MKSSPHRNAILFFGYFVPLLLLAALFVAIFVGHGRTAAAYQEKQTALERYRTASVQVGELDAMLSKEHRREKIAYWEKKLEQDFIQSITQNLNHILARYEPHVLRQTEMGQAPGVGVIASQIDAPHSRIQLSFEGGFKPMQLLLAELEQEMPQLVLESVEITSMPSTSLEESSRLRFRVVYLSWEKPQA